MDSACDLIRAAREQSALTQRQLAAATGIAQPVIARIETGRQNPGFAMVQRLIAACGLELATRPRGEVDPHDASLIETTVQLTPDQRLMRLTDLHRFAAELRAAPRRTQTKKG